MTPYQALWLSIGAALTTIALKWSAAWVTGSVGFLSDALESAVNLLGASFALAMVMYARKPADPGHPFGHGKAEYFASGFEGALIALAAAGILYAAGQRIAYPEPLHTLGRPTASGGGGAGRNTKNAAPPSTAASTTATPPTVRHARASVRPTVVAAIPPGTIASTTRKTSRQDYPSRRPSCSRSSFGRAPRTPIAGGWSKPVASQRSSATCSSTVS